MELGNMLFDGATGGHEVERGAGYEEILQRLFDAYSKERDTSWRDYGEEFENGTFCVWPYSWCDCDCGYMDMEAAWSKTHWHAESCYQSRRDRALKQWELMHDWDKFERESSCDIKEVAVSEVPELPGMKCTTISTSRSEKAEAAHQEWKKLYDLRRKHEERTSRNLCRELKIPWNKGRGSAVHCTCSHDAEWREWSATNRHNPICAAARRSFVYKPTGFWLDWYKYPLRDAHASEKLTLETFTSIIDACIASLEMDTGGKVERLIPQTQPASLNAGGNGEANRGATEHGKER